MLAAGVEENNRCAGSRRDLAERGGRILAQLVNLEFGETPEAVRVVLEKRANFGAAGLAEEQKPDAHGVNVTTLAAGASVQSIFLSFIEQGLAADAQDFGGPGDLVAGSFEGRLNRFVLDVFQ